MSFRYRHDGFGIVDAEMEVVHSLLHSGHLPGFVPEGGRTGGELGYPFLDKNPRRVVVVGLFHGVINTDGVDARHAGLHLELRVVNARLEIQKKRCQMHRARLPGLPQQVREERHQHGPHPKIEVARLVQTTHTGVHEGKTRAPFGPSQE